MELVIFGIPNCDTCRQAQKFLDRRNIGYRFHDVRMDGLDIQMLERWADQLGWERLVNRRSLTWRKLPESERDAMTREKAFAVLLEQPTLLKRPVLEGDGLLAIGFSEKRFGDHLEKSA